MSRKYNGVDHDFVTKLTQDLEGLPYNELKRRAIVYGTLYWAVFSRTVHETLPTEEIKLPGKRGKTKVVDKDVVKAYLESKRHSVMTAVQALATLEDFDLDLK